ncbi:MULTISPECIES: cupin domain-containing protein [unclassified Methylobacterium]|jgi:mannose-6-phosphate isomerase-like protein (cupin superfamily)|uniref:cupin domain-containing protein n=1 Tax=unclassified Methylobacterium TaxID=2615210 RepID=UPI001355B12D|nr:cupin domain-containing protein [Methylobacterium sp. 2A]MWV23657.1 cupin domain-containing protein [Methylobacterium sp. 2A]
MAALLRHDAKPDAVIGGMRVTYLARSDATADAIGIYRVEMDPRTPGAGLHRHARLTETFAVEAGSLALHLDGTDIDLGPGDFTLVQPGRPHAFANRGDQPVRFTLSFTPALAREGFFEGLANLAAAGRLSDAAAMEHLMLRYDQEPLAGFDGWSGLSG